MTNYTINPGTRPGALEIAFTEKPDTATRDALKNLSFRWAPSRGVWYGFSDVATVENALQGCTVSTAPTVSAVPAVRRSLWDRVNVAEIGEHDRRQDANGSGWEKYMPVVPDDEYTVKEQKTQLRARNGAPGLYAFMANAVRDNFMTAYVDKIIEVVEERGK